MSANRKRGLFITLEGGEGAGKSTQQDRIRIWLERQGHDVICTREPGGTQLAEKVRDILLHRDHDELDDLAELLLVFAARAQHLAELIRPALAGGKVVLSDRFTDATWAYQGSGRGMSKEKIAPLEDLVHGDLQPDLTLLFDLPVEAGLQRVARRGEADRFETEALAFYERVRACYLQRAKAMPDRFAVIDAAPSIDAVWQQVEDVLEGRLLP